MPDNLSESQVIKIWQHQLLGKKPLVTEGGEPVEIIYPGRINDDRGADFRDAVITTSQGLIKGDIEVHVKSNAWRDHRHHEDAVYNRVILHVVMWNNNEASTILENGREIPILALDKYIIAPVNSWSNLAGSPSTLNRPCQWVSSSLTTDTLVEFLERAGEERFLVKAAGFEADLTRIEAGQSLYQGIMGALGYSKNKLPFRELAGRLPLHILESITQDKISDEENLARQQALLLGTAGLLPSQSLNKPLEAVLDGRWIDKLERQWGSYHHTEAMSANAWHLFKVRPNNSPLRRLLAMSYLTHRYREKGLLEELVNMVKMVPTSQGHLRLENGFLVTVSERWSSYFNFSSESQVRNLTLLGRRRAADITVNVLLPFTFAWSRLTYQPELEKKAFDLYRHYPKLAANSLERHMRVQLGLSSKLINSAQRQQGLIHIYNSLCAQGRCHDCFLSHLEVGNHIQI